MASHSSWRADGKQANGARMLLTSLLFTLLACDNSEKPAEAAKPAAAANPGDIPAPADVAAPPADAKKTDSGLAYKVQSPAVGEGESPTEWDKVEVHYTGWTTDGKMFDSSVKRGKTATFGLKQVIPGWTEGLQLMKKGEKTRFWIPVELAYNNRPGKPAGMLVFDVELVNIIPGKRPPAAPTDVAAIPADATKTASGLAYRILTPGTGTETPSKNAQVKVNYTGWTTDGKSFDSSIPRERPQSFGVSDVIPGWTEGLQLMTKGQKTLFWIPVELAYNNQAGKPAGMLVFEVELLEWTEPPPVPKDVAGPPKNAKKTSSGLAYVVLQKGNGKDKPSPTSRVTVHYTGWTKAGEMFDSSVMDGKPSTFMLGKVIPGWTEGLQLMTVGEKTRFWIPAELAYGETPQRPGAPSGALTFDVELIAVDAAPPVRPTAAPAGALGAPKPESVKPPSGSLKPEGGSLKPEGGSSLKPAGN